MLLLYSHSTLRKASVSPCAGGEKPGEEMSHHRLTTDTLKLSPPERNQILHKGCSHHINYESFLCPVRIDNKHAIINMLIDINISALVKSIMVFLILWITVQPFKIML